MRIAAIIAAFSSLSACGLDKCEDDTMAYVMTQRGVERSMKSPTSASFPHISSDAVSVTQSDECKFDVRGYVDGQNGFGATIRTFYTASIRYLPDEEAWRMTGLSFE